MNTPLHGKFPWHPVQWPVLVALCLVSLAAVAQGSHGGGSHGGGSHGGNHVGHGGGHFGGHRGGGHVFFGLGYWPWYYPPYYYPPYYYYPSTGVGPSSTPLYVEQGDEQAAPQSAYWYYCANSQGYYPYVAQCPGGWQRVRPEPPP